jgi:hypothetical protein
MTTDREQFEAWWTVTKVACDYGSAWQGWQAARAAPAQPSKEWLDEAMRLLLSARSIVERVAIIKLPDGTYFDKDCACTLFLAALREHLDKLG